ncbi:hypothetical protein ACJX0J_011509, partial [Zea mays]
HLYNEHRGIYLKGLRLYNKLINLIIYAIYKLSLVKEKKRKIYRELFTTNGKRIFVRMIQMNVKLNENPNLVI